MRKFTLLLFLLNCNPVFSDSIQKWTDTSGQIHYSDKPPPSSTGIKQQIRIYGSFDESAYDEAVKRNTTLYKEIRLIEKHEKSRVKAAETRLDDYLNSLEKKRKKLELAKEKKRQSRESERNRVSIKLKRSKQTKDLAEKHKQFGL